MLSPRGGGEGGRATHGILTVFVPRVGILIVRDVPRVGNFDMAAHLDSSKGWGILMLLTNYVVPWVGNLTHFFRKSQNPHHMPDFSPPPSGLTLIGA